MSDRIRSSDETVTLKNGTVECRSLVNVTMVVLRDLCANQPIVFYELVQKARDPQHQFWGDTAEVLRQRNLLEGNGDLHDSLRNVILCAVEGEGLELAISSPF